MVLGMINLAIELPLPQLEKLAIHRSFVFRIVLLLFQSFLTILYYQAGHLALVFTRSTTDIRYRAQTPVFGL